MDLTPSAWHLWLLAALVAGALEIKLSGFVMLWLAVGAVGAALFAGVGFGPNVQIAIFCVVSVALFSASRTIFKDFFMRQAERLKTGTEAMLGQEAYVVDALTEKGEGTVRINGELWSARTLDGPVAAGERVRVEQMEGLKLWVRKPTASLELPRGKEGS